MSVLGNMLVQELKPQIHTEGAGLCCGSMIHFSFNRKEMVEKSYFVLTEFSLSLFQSLKLKSSLDFFFILKAINQLFLFLFFILS